MIKSKKDVIRFVNGFEEYAYWDGTKHYFTFKKEEGIVTLMKYEDETITYHRMNVAFCDIKEIIICDVYEYIWANRKAINLSIKEKALKKRAII